MINGLKAWCRCYSTEDSLKVSHPYWGVSTRVPTAGLRYFYLIPAAPRKYNLESPLVKNSVGGLKKMAQTVLLEDPCWVPNQIG